MLELLIFILSGAFIALWLIELVSRIVGARRWRKGRHHVTEAYRRMLK